MKYERLTKRDCFEKGVDLYHDDKVKIYARLAELEDKIEQGKLMEINKPFIKKTKYGLYMICKATVIVVEDFDTKAEAEAKLKELKGEV
jgi:hypothetical protein